MCCFSSCHEFLRRQASSKRQISPCNAGLLAPCRSVRNQEFHGSDHRLDDSQPVQPTRDAEYQSLLKVLSVIMKTETSILSNFELLNCNYLALNGTIRFFYFMSHFPIIGDGRCMPALQDFDWALSRLRCFFWQYRSWTFNFSVKSLHLPISSPHSSLHNGLPWNFWC